MKSIIAATILALSIGAQADQFKTVLEDASFGFQDYDAEIAYPKFFSNSIPSYNSINEQLKENLLMGGCISATDSQADVSDQSTSGMSYDARARVVGLNKRYVGIEVMANDYCGGAHPNHYASHYTFVSSTGEMINMDAEVPAAKYDHVDNELLKEKLSALIYNQIQAEGRLSDRCYEGLSKQEALESIQMDYPMISGLAKRKQVILSTSPAHANGPCREIVRVPYTKVKSLIKAGSILHKLLK
jgi:hypothetical protein